MSGLGDKIKGKALEAVGSAKEGIGKATDNPDLHESGLADKAKGKGNQVKGEAKEAAADVKDTVTRKRD